MSSLPDTAESLREHASELGLCLEIRRGRTEFPVRPVRHDRFLIGGDSDCDLQLGGDDMPALHSMLYFDGTDLWAETLAPAPPLRVQGREVESCLLKNGDRLQIGPFEFVVRLDTRPLRVDAGRQAHAPHFEVGTASEPAPHELNPEQLVDALERELALVERFDRHQNLATEALLDAARQSHSPSATDVSPLVPVSEQNLVSAQNTAELLEKVRCLEQRSEQLELRESAYRNTAATMLEMQARLTRQLDAIEERVAEIETREEPSPSYRRATG